MTKTLVFINNQISSMMAECALKKEGIELSQVIVFLLRDIDDEWLNHCHKVLRSPHASDGGMNVKINLVVYHIKAFFYLKILVSNKKINSVFLVNSDNVLTNYLLNNKALKTKNVSINVLVEGLMNFQDITIKNRSKFSIIPKHILSLFLGFKYKVPQGHLSASYMDSIKHVYSFSPIGLKSPIGKVRVCNSFVNVKYECKNNSNSILLILSGLYKWMPKSSYELFCISFKEYLSTLSFDKIKVKPHPRCIHDPILDYLPNDIELLESTIPLEKMIDILDVKNAIGFCSTAIAMLHIIDPSVNCFDYGADFYCDEAYYGDKSVMDFFEGIGIKAIQYNS